MTEKVPEADPLYAGEELFVAEIPTRYEPALAEDGLVTVRVVEALEPALIVRPAAAKAAVQPAGAATCRLKLDAVQLELSLSVTVIV